VHTCSTGQVQLQVRAEPGPPVILEAKEGSRLEVKEGEEVRLECQSQGGVPPADLVWRQEGSMEVEGLRGTKQHVEKREDGRTFRTTSEIKFLPVSDVTIECWAESNEVGVKRSTSVQVELVAPPKVKLRSDRTINDEVWVEEGEKVEIGCEVEARPMKVNYTWIVGGSEMKGEKGETLLVEGMEELEGSEVVCLAENAAGAAQEKIIIRIATPPIITLHPDFAFANEGEEGRLKCEASGRPEPALAWVREDTGEVVGLGPELIIPQVTRQTEGRFICQALAPKKPPTSSKTGMLLMRGPPQIVSLEEGRLGARTVLECKAYSPGERTIFEWIKGGEQKSRQEEGNLEESLMQTSFLVLEEEERATEYSCRVTNNAGKDERMVAAEEADSTLIFILGITLPILLLFFVVIFICVIRKKKSRESLERMERGKLERKRCLSHRNISFVDDSGGNPGLND